MVSSFQILVEMNIVYVETFYFDQLGRGFLGNTGTCQRPPISEKEKYTKNHYQIAQNKTL